MDSAIQADSVPQAIGELFPPLRTYCPILPLISAPQAIFLIDLKEVTEAHYGGAVGGGKTAALLMAALQYVDVPGYSALILRRTFPELEQSDGPIPQALRWFAEAPKSVRPRWNGTEHRWTFPSGATITFGHLQHADSMIRYQGGGYHYTAFDELTHFAEQAYDFIGFSRTRRPQVGPLSKVPIRVRSTSNPGGPGHLWVKRRFITERKPDVVFIPAKLHDNPGIDEADYLIRLHHLPEALQKQLIDGDYDAFEGAAFEVGDAHLIDEFALRDSHERFEAADYGLNGAPWALWVADYDGNLIVYDLLYERDKLISDLVPLIKDKRAMWGNDNLAWLDPSVWHRTGTKNRLDRPVMLADEFIDNGVIVVPANPDPRAGMMRLRELLKLDPAHPFPSWHPRRGEFGAPRLFFRRGHVDELVEELGGAPLQPIDKRLGGEIIDPDWEGQYGHAVAMARYAVMTRPEPSEEPDPIASIPGPLRDYSNVAEQGRREWLAKRLRRPTDDDEWGYDPDADAADVGYTI